MTFLCKHSEKGKTMQQDAYGKSNSDKSAQPPMKVLVVEDEDNIVELIKLGLRYEGFHVDAISDGSQGLAMAQRLDPDMVILDLGLQPGGIDGLEVCRQLRTNPTTQDIPILMLTARDAAQDKVLGRQTILNRVWGYDFLGETNIIEVYVRYLREKIEDSPSSPRLIQTVRGVGYVLKG